MPKMNVITAEILASFRLGFNASFKSGLALAPLQWQKVASEVKSTTAVNLYGWLNKIPRLREWLGERYLNKLRTSGYSLENKKFEESIAVERTDIEDDQMGMYPSLFTELGRATQEHIEESVFGLLRDNGLCWDGQNFFDTDHPIFGVDGDKEVLMGTYSNVFTGAANGSAWYLLDGSRAVKPLVYQNRSDAVLTAMDQNEDESVFMRDQYRYGVRVRRAFGYGMPQLAFKSTEPLTAENYAKVKAAMANMTTDNARKLGVRPTILVVPPSMEHAARLLLKAAVVGATSNVYLDDVEIVVTPFLA